MDTQTIIIISIALFSIGNIFFAIYLIHKSSSIGTKQIGELQKSLDQLSSVQDIQFKHSMDALTRQLGIIKTEFNEQVNNSAIKTDHIFHNVIKRLTQLDVSQKNIEKLTEDVVSIHDLFNDKRSRGAFGETQLEHLIANVLPKNYYQLQATLSNGRRVDCLILLPSPGGHLPIDVKFPLENYQKAIDADDTSADQHWSEFRSNLKKHIDDIASRYILPPETTEHAVMFLPAESLFNETLNRFPDIIEYAQKRKVCISSPTNLMAIIYASRSIIKDHRTHQHMRKILKHLSSLGKDFSLFEQRLTKYFSHIKLAYKDTELIEHSSQKLLKHFNDIDKVDSSEVITEKETV
tara:strand:+ start:3049 stop:4098 length:1050 start_codon:yes stop_codon:yes gene_type:complete